MDKYKHALLSIFILCFLTACGKKQDSIILPATEDVISITVYDRGASAVSITPNFIEEFMALLETMETTDRQSVNDTPSADQYIEISLECKDKTVTIFYYKDYDTSYIEQPYQGIYKPDARLGEMITELFDSVDGTAAPVSFQATVIEIQDSYILVEPFAGSTELLSADRIYLPNPDNIELQLGEYIEIEYDGSIMETDPAQLGKVYRIIPIEQQ